MNWATRILNNQAIAVANKLAPIFSATMLLGYTVSGFRLRVANPDDAIVAAVKRERLSPMQQWRAWMMGGG